MEMDTRGNIHQVTSEEHKKQLEKEFGKLTELSQSIAEQLSDVSKEDRHATYHWLKIKNDVPFEHRIYAKKYFIAGFKDGIKADLSLKIE